MKLHFHALALSAAIGLSIQAHAQDSSSGSALTSIPNTPYFYTNELIVELDTKALGQAVDDVAVCRRDTPGLEAKRTASRLNSAVYDRRAIRHLP